MQTKFEWKGVLAVEEPHIVEAKSKSKLGIIFSLKAREFLLPTTILGLLGNSLAVLMSFAATGSGRLVELNPYSVLAFYHWSPVGAMVSLLGVLAPFYIVGRLIKQLEGYKFSPFMQGVWNAGVIAVLISWMSFLLLDGFLDVVALVSLSVSAASLQGGAVFVVGLLLIGYLGYKWVWVGVKKKEKV